MRSRPFRAVMTFGSCATGTCEMCQGGNTAALSGSSRVPQECLDRAGREGTVCGNRFGVRRTDHKKRHGFRLISQSGSRIFSVCPDAAFSVLSCSVFCRAVNSALSVCRVILCALSPAASVPSPSSGRPDPCISDQDKNHQGQSRTHDDRKNDQDDAKR